MRKHTFENDQVYHIYNRGVEKRNIFLDDKDRFRFIYNIFEFNDEAPAENTYYKTVNFQSYEVGLRKIEKEGKERKLIVEVLAFCLMPNHFHLLIKQRTDGGIVTFMRKLGTGYTNYFNKKNERVGPLFQGKFKSVLIEKDAHFIHLPYYIHLNPLDILKKQRKDKISTKKAIEFLESYRWSSYLDYIGKKNFPSVTQREFLLEFFESTETYKKDTDKWIKESNVNPIKDIILE